MEHHSVSPAATRDPNVSAAEDSAEDAPAVKFNRIGLKTFQVNALSWQGAVMAANDHALQAAFGGESILSDEGFAEVRRRRNSMALHAHSQGFDAHGAWEVDVARVVRLLGSPDTLESATVLHTTAHSQRVAFVGPRPHPHPDTVDDPEFWASVAFAEHESVALGQAIPAAKPENDRPNRL